MGGLSYFLKGSRKEKGVLKFVASESFLDETGKAIAWELKTISSAQDEAVREACTKRVAAPGRKNVSMPELDINAYMGKVAALCTVYPDLNDAQLQDSYGVMGAEGLLKEMLLPGEYQEYLKQVQILNGFDIGMEELVEEAKN